jgi:haloalkane dehalogenase
MLLMFRIFVVAVVGFVMVSVTQAQETPQIPAYRSAEFSAEFPYESKFIDVLGSKMHYIDEGEGDTFLFLHGNPTSSYLWRNVMRYVKPHGRIVAVDNVGFGKSDKPDVDYTLQTHIQYTDAFIEELGLKDVILVIHDWGSALGLNYAATHSRNVKGVVMMEALIPPGLPADSVDLFGPAADIFRQFRDPKAGRALIIDQNIFIEQFMANAALTRTMPDEVVDVYRAPFVDPASREPIYVWPNEIPIGGVPARNVEVVERYGEWLKKSRTPKLLQYASPGVLVTPERAEWAAENFHNIETQFVGYGVHFIQEDNPQAIGRGIVDWHRRNFKK